MQGGLQTSKGIHTFATLAKLHMKFNTFCAIIPCNTKQANKEIRIVVYGIRIAVY